MPLQVPAKFMSVPYDGNRHPQSAEFDFGKGANCQLWAYAVLKHFGVHVPPLRSSQLWEDKEPTEVARELRPLDLLLFNGKNDSWGAHVAIYLGDDAIAHLSKKNGLPAICTMEEMFADPKYTVLVGAKRIKTPNKAPEATRCPRA